MTQKLDKLKLNFRKLKLSDYNQFKNLFFLCFNKKISFEFFKWRYFSDKISFCYGVFHFSKLIANVGMVSNKLNDKKNTEVFSRHSSMVSPKYRGIGIFSELLNKVKNKKLNNISFIFMWPNKRNFASFGFRKSNIKEKKYYLYQISSKKNPIYRLKKNSIENLDKFKNYIKSENNSLFYKNYEYFKHRYIGYKKRNYFINEFNYKTSKSFLILKKIKKTSDLKFVILDHFGSKELISKHFLYLINCCSQLIFLTKKKVKNKNYKFLNTITFKVGMNKKLNLKINKDIHLGDTDIFITL